MTDRPNDRPSAGNAAPDDPEPRLTVIIDGREFPRPGLETFFAESGREGQEAEPQQRREGCSCHPVAGVYCSCNKVCTCIPVCGCVGHVSCSCDSHRSRGGGTVYGCRCAPVH